METNDLQEIELKKITEIVSKFLDGDKTTAISFLRENKNLVGEFCLQVRDSYQKTDSTTPILQLSFLIEELL